MVLIIFFSFLVKVFFHYCVNNVVNFTVVRGSVLFLEKRKKRGFDIEMEEISLRHLKFAKNLRSSTRAAVKHSFFLLPGLSWVETDYSIYFRITSSNLLFDGLYSKKISFSFYISYPTIDLMTVLWNTSTNLFLPKPAQAEKKRMFDCSRLSNLGDQLADLPIFNGLENAWEPPINFILSLSFFLIEAQSQPLKTGLNSPRIRLTWTSRQQQQ